MQATTLSWWTSRPAQRGHRTSIGGPPLVHGTGRALVVEVHESCSWATRPLATAHGVEPGAGDDHGLGLAFDRLPGPVGEVLGHDPHLLAGGVGGEIHERSEEVLGLPPVVARVVDGGLEEKPVGPVGGLVLQHVEDEPLLDRLAHRVEAPGLELPIPALRAEQLEGAGLGVAVKAKKLTLGSGPRRRTAWRIRSSSSSSGVGTAASSASAASRLSTARTVGSLPTAPSRG